MTDPLPVTPCGCPRCGYDQRGIVASWTSACPITGICSECGYGFRWIDVLHPERNLLPGFFEHAKGRWKCWLAAFRTLGWALLPWMFWSRVKLHYEPRPRRLVLWAPIVFGSIWVATAAMRVGAFYGDIRMFPPRELVNAFIFPVGLWWSGTQVELLIIEWSPLYFGVFAASVGWPLLLLVLPETRRRAKVRKVHVLRASVYGLAWLAVHLSLLLISALMGMLGGDWFVSLAMRGPVIDFLEEASLWYGLFLAAWIGAWWWFVLAWGFQIQRPTLHWLVLLLPTLLAMAVFVVVDQNFIESFLM